MSWENGEVASEPLSIIAADDLVTCEIYARENKLHDLDGWKHFKGIVRGDKKLLCLFNQAKLQSYCITLHYKYGYEVPWDYIHAVELDKCNGNTKWQVPTALEMTQLHEYKTFKDVGTGAKPLKATMDNTGADLLPMGILLKSHLTGLFWYCFTLWAASSCLTCWAQCSMTLMFVQQTSAMYTVRQRLKKRSIKLQALNLVTYKRHPHHLQGTLWPQDFWPPLAWTLCQLSPRNGIPAMQVWTWHPDVA